MDGQQLDALARRFALSRRGALRALAGGLAISALGLCGRAPVAAKPKPAGCKQFCDAAGLTGEAKGRCYHDCAQGGTTGLFADCNGDLTRLRQTATGPVCCPELGEACATDSDCCSGAARCQDGICSCCTDEVIGSCGGYTTQGFCCPHPQTALLCCSDNACDDDTVCILKCHDSTAGNPQAQCPPEYQGAFASLGQTVNACLA